MTWWTIPAIVGGALAGAMLAALAALALGVRRPAPPRGGGGPHEGPRWDTDGGARGMRYARDNDVSWNPAALGAAVVGLAAIAGLAVGLALS